MSDQRGDSQQRFGAQAGTSWSEPTRLCARARARVLKGLTIGLSAASRRRPEYAGVVVFGMGRSGTSMVARMLHHAGFHVGSDEMLMSANSANSMGYFENLNIVALNEQVLAELGGSWSSPPRLASQCAARERIAPRLRGSLDGLIAEANVKPVAVKDPRIGVLLPMWWPTLDGILYPMLTVRHPLEIARSLKNRDGMAIGEGLAAWELHMSIVLDTLSGRTVSVVPHRELLATPELAAKLVKQAQARLRPELAEAVSPQAAPDAIERGLNHSHANDDDTAAYLTVRQRRLWKLLEALPVGETRIKALKRLRSARGRIAQLNGPEWVAAAPDQ